MIDSVVWRKTDRKRIPKDRRLTENTLVFKINRDGTYRARLVALGYSQIPGVDYTDNFAPVAHDVSFRIALARMMVEQLDSLVMDGETAFLYGEINEEILMKSLVGMEEIEPGSSSEDFYQLLKGIWFMPSSKAILEEICAHRNERTFWIHSKPCRSMHAI